MNRFTPLRQKVITAAFLFNMMMLQIILAGCHRQPVHNPNGQQPQARYGSGIPEESELEMLNTIGLSVKKISCYAEYTRTDILDGPPFFIVSIGSVVIGYFSYLKAVLKE